MKRANNAKQFQRPNILDVDRPKVGIIICGDSRLRSEADKAVLRKMAEAAAALITGNIHHADGEPVKCVISDFVGGRAELARCQALFRKENVRVVLHVSAFWCYCASVLWPDKRTPQAIWGFNGTDRPGAVYEAAALSHCLDTGARVFGIYGRDVQPFDETANIADDVREKILHFVSVGMVVATMRGMNYLSVGGTSMDINGSIPRPKLVREYLDMGFEFIDMVEVFGRMDQGVYDQDEFEVAKQWVADHCKPGFDPNPDGSNQDQQVVSDKSVKMAMIMMDLMRGNSRLSDLFPEKSLGVHALFAGYQGQRCTDYTVNGDFMEAILNSTFDWTGQRIPFVTATENDALNAFCMLFGHLLTEGAAQIFADLRTFWSPEAVAKAANGYMLTGWAANGLLHLINSGPAALDGTGQQSLPGGTPTMKPWWKVTDEDADACLEATTWHPADKVYFPGGGRSTRYCTLGEMPCTMTRILLEEDGNLVMHIVEGWSVELPAEVHEALDNRTNPTWPTTWFAPRGLNPYKTMNGWGSNHCVVSAGHIGQMLRSLAALLGIPIGITNLDPSQMFLPAQWNIYGEEGKVTQDVAIARRLGSLYR